MPANSNKLLWRRLLLLLLYLLLPALAMTFVFTSSIDSTWRFYLLSLAVLCAVYLAITVVVVPRLKRRWETSDKREATSDDRQFVLVLRPFNSPLVERRPGSLGKSEGTIVNNFCSRLQSLGNFSVACIGDGASVSGDKEPSEFVRVEPARDKWFEVFTLLAARCVAIIVIPDATDGCIRELLVLSKYPTVLRKTLVWMPREQHKDIVLIRWEANRRNLSPHGLRLPPYDKRGLMYRPKTDFSIDVVSRFTGRPEDAAVKEISNMVVPARPGLREALKELDVKGIRW